MSGSEWGPLGRTGWQLGRRGGPRRRVLQLQGRDHRDASSGARRAQAVRPGRKRQPGPLRPRPPDGSLASGRGGPLPHPGRLLAVGWPGR